MLKAISKEAFRVRSIKSLTSTLLQAIEVALTAPTGVVSVEIPIAIQKLMLTAPEISFESRPSPAPALLSIKEAASILASAKRPLIWSGNGVIQADATEELTTIAEMWGAGVITSQAGRGAIREDHLQCIGNFAYNSAIRDFLAACDVLLAVGTRFRGSETRVWQLPLPKTIVQIDVDRLAIGRNYPATVGCVADATCALLALINELAGKVKPNMGYLQEVQQARNACRDALRATLGVYDDLCFALSNSLDQDAILGADVTISAMLWGSRLIPVNRPRQYILAAGGGFQVNLGE